MGKLAWFALALGLLSCGPVRDDECIDEDADGVCVFDDVDDKNEKCGTDPTDADGDNACLGIDCDDSTATGAACVDGCMTAYPDADGDGFGNQAAATTKCALGPGFVGDTGLFDCDDTVGSGRNRVPIDFDGDGANSCDDCDDTDPALHPAAPELCDGIDNDCNAATDEAQGDPDGDGLLGCGDKCPMQAVGTPSEIVWEWLETNVGQAADPCACVNNQVLGTGTYTFTINGMTAGSAASTSPQCNCNTVAQTTTTPPTGWNPTLAANSLAFSITNPTSAHNLVAWVRARLKYADNSERVVCVFDHTDGDCTVANLCTAGFCDASNSCGNFQACTNSEFSEDAPPEADADNDGFGAQCDCADNAANRNPSRSELCTNAIDDDCDGNADMMDDECVACNRTVRSEANRCDNMLDDDCDGKMDGEDDDCVGSICLNPAPIPLVRDGVHDRRTGNFDLCRMGPTDAVSTACGTADSQPDHWQRVTVYDPAEKGYRIEYCFDGQTGELLTSDMFACGTDLACLKTFMTPGPNNCVIDPPTGAYEGTRTVPLVFRSMPACGPNMTAVVNWRITVLPP